ncbi:MAG: glucosaminidase domain-containing protein [Bacteroidales bacterium]|nr:glucosaminidase domain-containing protein [Bacteroidales bacterium]
MRYRLLLLLVLVPAVLLGQKQRKITREEYIDTYKELAMKEMERTNIPASITLAQGILESGDGNSRLATKGNNHFGIKCHDWNGKTMREDDDEKNECFRKYKSVEHSFRDHSDFLVGRSRYADLFTLKPDDYKAWAKGLKKAGYATSPTYADRLIHIIEENELYKYDRQVLAKTGGKAHRRSDYADTEYAGGRKVHYNNRVKYVLAREGDRFYNLSEELDLFEWQLPKYNDMPADKVFGEGDIVYLQPKRNKADIDHDSHSVKEGETLRDISQKYAVKLEKLALRNMLEPDAVLKPGQVLLLRGRIKGKRERMVFPKLEIREEPREEIIIDFDADK